MSVYFAIFESRLGLKFPPIGDTELNLGVEEGGTSILQNIINLKGINNQIYTFPTPEELNDDTYLKDVLSLYFQQSNTLSSEWLKNEKLVSLGGDHSTAFISLSSVLNRFGNENVAVIMFDSHGDLHMPTTSPTGNFHGMWLRAFFEKFTKEKQSNPLIKPDQLRFVGNLLLEKEEERFIKANRIKVYSSQEATEDNAVELFRWAQNHKHLHISFDVDVFNDKIMSATGTRNPKGFAYKEVEMFLKKILSHPSYSIDIVEFNPLKPGSKKGLQVIAKILKSIESTSL